MKGFAMKGMLTVALCWSLLFTACQNEDSAGDESDTAMEQVQAPSADASGGENGSGNAANADTSADSSGTNADANGGSGDSASTAGADSSDTGTVGDDSGSDADNAGNPTAGSGNDVGANDSDNNADGSGDNADAGTSNTDNSSSDAGAGSDSGTSGNETNAGGNNVNGDSSSNANGSDDNASVGSSGGTDNNGSSASGSGDANTSETDVDVGNTTGTSSGNNSNGSGASGTTGSSGTIRDDIEDSATGSDGSDSAATSTMSGGRLVQRDVTTWNGVTVGDVILRDGSRVSAASLADGINSDNPPVAVVAYFVDGGYVAVGMPSEELAWTASDNADATKKFTAVASNKIPTDDGYDFTGVVDGSTSWQKLCDCDATGMEEAALHYPAFFYAKNYATESRVSGDWYVPSIAELYEVYVNHDRINQSLESVGQTTLTKMYWSSSLYETKQHETNSAWYLNFKTSKKPYYTVTYESKTKSHSVLPIRVFTDDSSAQ